MQQKLKTKSALKPNKINHTIRSNLHIPHNLKQKTWATSQPQQIQMLAQPQNAKKLHGTQLDMLTHNDATLLLVVAIALAKFGRCIIIIYMLCDNVINDIVDIDPNMSRSK